MVNRLFLRRIAVWTIAVSAGCSSSPGGPSGSGGATAASGGSLGSGGASATGGAIATGGHASGGSPGGASTGGTVGSGGVTASGGAGGRPATTGAGGAAGMSGVGGSAGAAGARGTGGAAGGALGACGSGTAASGDLTVDLGAFEQTMDGFGVSNTYQSTAISDATADQFFDASKGIGLSIFRLGIKSDGTSWGPIGDAQKAAARGAIVWAAPWTPPANCKSNNSLTNGGHLNSSCYDSWSSTLAAFPAKAKQSGVTVVGISAQNEPDNQTMYESCLYTGAEMVSFLKVLGPKLKALNPPVKLLAPESTRWERLWGADEDYGDAILADSQAAAQVDILATHMYETQDAVAPPPGVTKPIWVTEMSGVMGYPNAGPSSDIDDGLVWAGWIHAAITTGHASAYHAWWIQSLNSDNEGLLTMSGGTTKRMYALGNFSKFIRPGFRRVDVSGTPPASVQLTAYTNPTDGTVVVVAVNGGTSAVSLPLFLSGKAPCAMTPWVTSASDNLASKTAVAVSGSRLAPMLAAKSVTTFVGKP